MGWKSLKHLVETLRNCQQSDGSIPDELKHEVTRVIEDLNSSIQAIVGEYEYQREYLVALIQDFTQWKEDGFRRPNFRASLDQFNPQRFYEHGMPCIAIFPMFTINGSNDIKFDAILMEFIKPDWLASSTVMSNNPKYISASLIDYTNGYNSNAAVFFPETISTHKDTISDNKFRIFFSNREASRLAEYVKRIREFIEVDISDELEMTLNSESLMKESFVLWDLFHDSSHSLGYQPYDRFLTKQRSPYFIYGLEELRVDVRSYKQCLQCAADLTFARQVSCLIIFDRIFRFSIAGDRKKNMDSLAGQIMLAALFQDNSIVYYDNKLELLWDKIDTTIIKLNEAIEIVYKHGLLQTRLEHWKHVYVFISQYVTPAPNSKWVQTPFSNTEEALTNTIDDEFPLCTFLLMLRRHAGRRGENDRIKSDSAK